MERDHTWRGIHQGHTASDHLVHHRPWSSGKVVQAAYTPPAAHLSSCTTNCPEALQYCPHLYDIQARLQYQLHPPVGHPSQASVPAAPPVGHPSQASVPAAPPVRHPSQASVTAGRRRCHATCCTRHQLLQVLPKSASRLSCEASDPWFNHDYHSPVAEQRLSERACCVLTDAVLQVHNPSLTHFMLTFPLPSEYQEAAGSATSRMTSLL